MRTIVGPVRVCQDGAAIESETTAVSAGPHVVVLTTAVPALGVLVTTTFVGGGDVDTVAVDLRLGPRPAGTNRTRVIPRASVPVTHDRRTCLLDHARELIVALRAHDRRHYTVDVSEDALERADAAL